MNKYRPGGRCGGDTTKSSPVSSGSPVNPEFNSSLAALMAQRDKQDAMWVGPTSQDKTEVKPEVKPEIKNQIVVKPTSKPNNDAYIKLLLEGDYEE
jgi:hypothetical protein